MSPMLDNMQIRRRKDACNQNPQKCTFLKSKDELCNKYPRYCNPQNVFLGVYNEDPICQRDCPLWEELVEDFSTLSEVNNISTRIPYDRVYFTNNDGEPAVCKSYGLKAPLVMMEFNRTALDNSQIKRNFTKFITWIDLQIELRLNPENYLDPRATPSVYFVMHDSSRLVNPFREGIKLKNNHLHRIVVRGMLEQRLLPSPYDTKCTELELNPSSNKNYDFMDCVETCAFQRYTQQINCVPRSIRISHSGKLCESGVEVTEQIRDFCVKSCGKPCKSLTYQFEHRPNELIDSSGFDLTSLLRTAGKRDVYEWQKKIMILLSFRKFRKKTISFVPKIEPFDLFSNIGGFLGIFIGSSFITLLDLLCRVMLFLFTYFEKLLMRKTKIEHLSKEIKSRRITRFQ